MHNSSQIPNPQNGKKKRSKRTEEQRTNTRLWLVLVPIFVGLLGLSVGRLFYFHIIKREEYRGQALQQKTRQVSLPAKRGNIYDRNNKLLVQSARVWDICISPAELKEEELTEVAEDLAEILDISTDVIYKASKTVTPSGEKSYYAVIKHKVDNSLKEEVEDYLKREGDERGKIRWVYPQETTKRYYIYDNLASTVLGFTNEEGDGVYGVESYYNNILSGTPGVEISVKNAVGSDMPYSTKQVYQAKDGNSLVLTIDETIQSILEKNLEMAVIEHDVQEKAASIFMNMKTGEVLGMATMPDFNPNQPWEIQDEELQAILEEMNPDSEEYEDLYNQGLYNQWQNKTISDGYEPGSVFKIVTTAAGLEERLTYPDDMFYCPGYYEFEGGVINCWNVHGHGMQSLWDGMRNSCNPVFLEMGIRIGPERTYNNLQSFGFGKNTGIDLPGEVAGVLHSQSSLAHSGQNALANTSFGQSFTCSPIQLATAISATLNGGYLMEPFVVKQILDMDGNVVETTEPYAKRQVISEETSKTIQQLVEPVVTEGTGRHSGVPGYRIGGKTGTSEKLVELDKKDVKKYVLSFAGFAPMDDPTYLCLVLLDEPQISNALSSVIAAPVVGAIFQEALPYLGLEPHFTPEELAEKEVTVPYLINWKPHDAQAELTTAGLHTNIIGTGGTVLRQIPQAGQIVDKGSAITLYTQEETIEEGIILPDFIGLSIEDAKKELLNLGLNLEIRGVTDDSLERVVEQQWPLPEAPCDTGDVVILTLQVKMEEVSPTDLPAIDRDG